MSKKKELGEILLEADLINQSQLSEALGLQETVGERLASILVRRRMITEKFAVTYLGRQLGIVPIDLSSTELDLELLDLISLDLCERHVVFPIRIESGRLLLAMSNPKDQGLIERIEADTGARLGPLIALESSIKHAIAEARTALQNGQRTITPNVQLLDEAEAAVRLPRPGPVEPDEPSPRDLASPPQPTAETDPPPAGPREPPCVIIAAATESTALDDLETALGKRGDRVLKAASGRELLTLVRRTMPDLVLAEGLLPDLEGYDACHKIKTDPRFRGIPVILAVKPGLGWRFAVDVKDKYEADDVIELTGDLVDLQRRIDLHLARPSPGSSPEAETQVRQLLKDGVVALKKGNHEEAVEVLARALDLDPFSDLVHYYLAMAYEKMDRTLRAIHHFEESVRLNPDFSDAIISLANLYQARGFRSKAVDMWELALQATRDEEARARMKEHILSQL